MTVDLYEVTGELADPFYTGSGSTALEEVGLPVSIEGRGYMPDLDPNLGYYHRMQSSSLQLLNTQQQQSNGDNAQVPPEIWRRSVESWVQGAGQARIDRDTSLPSRFSASSNVDVWTPWQLGLLNRTSMIQALPAGRSFMTTVGSAKLFIAAGTQGYWFTSLSVAPTSETLPVSIVDLCSDGTNLYTLDNAGAIRKYTAPATSTLFATIPATFLPARAMLRFVKGFLIAANGKQLYDVTSGTPVSIFQHPLVDFTWVDACAGDDAAYLVGGVGDRWQVLSMTVTALGTTFDPPSAAAPLPDGEIAYAIESYLGYIVVGLSTGWRFGTPSGQGKVTLGRLINSDAPVRCFEGQDRFVWYGQSSTATAHAGLGRADLSTFVGTVTPASAPDLSTALDGVVRCVTTFGPAAGGIGKRVFTIDGVGLVAEQPDLATSGWLEQGAMNFGTTDPKMAVYMQLFHQPLVGQVAVDVRYDGGAWNEVAIDNASGATSMGNVALQHTFGTVEVRYRLTRDEVNNTQSPTVTRMEMRVLPVAGRASQWRIPLILRDTLEYGGVTQTRLVEEDYDHLIDLVQTHRLFQYREGRRTWSLYATDFVFLPDDLCKSGKAFQGTFILSAKEVV